jgi:hypothetical protein
MNLISFPGTSKTAARRSRPTELTKNLSHRCNADDCEEVVRPHAAFCAHHSSLLTNDLRFALTSNRVTGSIFRYFNAVEDACDFIRDRERTSCSITAR